MSDLQNRFRSLANLLNDLKKILTLKNPIGNALMHFAQREKELGMFLHDGKLFMDTNIYQNIIGSKALCRNNYLFAGSHDAAQMQYQLILVVSYMQTVDVNPYDWFKHLTNSYADVPSRLH